MSNYEAFRALCDGVKVDEWIDKEVPERPSRGHRLERVKRHLQGRILASGRNDLDHRVLPTPVAPVAHPKERVRVDNPFRAQSLNLGQELRESHGLTIFGHTALLRTLPSRGSERPGYSGRWKFAPLQNPISPGPAKKHGE